MRILIELLESWETTFAGDGVCNSAGDEVALSSLSRSLLVNKLCERACSIPDCFQLAQGAYYELDSCFLRRLRGDRQSLCYYLSYLIFSRMFAN